MQVDTLLAELERLQAELSESKEINARERVEERSFIHNCWHRVSMTIYRSLRDGAETKLTRELQRSHSEAVGLRAALNKVEFEHAATLAKCTQVIECFESGLVISYRPPGGGVPCSCSRTANQG